MKEDLKRKVFVDTLKQFTPVFGVVVFIWCVNFVLFLLYDVSLEPFFYSGAISFVVIVILFISKFLKNLKKARERRICLTSILTDYQNLPDAETLTERDYQEMVEILGAKINDISESFLHMTKEAEDFYTTWVHQIKTPIAVMRLILDNDDSETARDLKNELFRIEEYTNMVLQYIRLSEDARDLDINSYDLDEIIRESIRKYANQFVRKKLSLNFVPSNLSIATDKKWLSLIIDQLISNAIKYTNEGTIDIFVENEALCIKDTGIGISASDIPRIFEKGFTGNNGRLENKSSGLGLYLCKKAAYQISVDISVKSKIGEGTQFIISNII